MVRIGRAWKQLGNQPDCHRVRFRRNEQRNKRIGDRTVIARHEALRRHIQLELDHIGKTKPAIYRHWQKAKTDERAWERRTPVRA